MKTAKFLFLTLAIALVSGIMTSCSKDESSDEPEQPTVKMYPISIFGGYPSIPDFYGVIFENCVYDSEGRILSYTDDSGNVSYSYSSQTIIRKKSYGDVTFTLDSKGMITSDSEGHKFQYDSNNYIINDGYDSYEWKDGNMIKCGYDTYTYNDNLNTVSCFLHMLYSTVYFDSCDPFLMASGFYGKIPKNLVSKYYSDGDLEWNFNYEFNSNGYPSKISTSDDSYTAEYFFEWRSL